MKNYTTRTEKIGKQSNRPKLYCWKQSYAVQTVWESEKRILLSREVNNIELS